MSQGVSYKFRNKLKKKPIIKDDVVDTSIIQHHFVYVKYTHLCIRHGVQTSRNIKGVVSVSSKEGEKLHKSNLNS